jgi:hypothetical protein
MASQTATPEGVGIQGPAFVGSPATTDAVSVTTTSTTANVTMMSARVSIVLFKPEHLYVISPPLTFFDAAQRTPVTGSWEELAKFLSRSLPGDPNRFPDPNVAKRARGAWVPGTYKGTNGHANLASMFIATMLLVLDVDSGDPHAVAEVLSGYAVIIHSTYKHTLTASRCRVVFLLASPCTSPRDYNTGLKVIASMLNARGFVVPAKDSTLGKLAYLPMHQVGVEPVFIVNKGKPLDLPRIVQAESQRQAHDVGQKPKPQTTTTSPAYAQGALRKASDTVATSRSTRWTLPS